MDKVRRDVNQYFVEGLGGIDPDLKAAMRDFLMNKITSSLNALKK